MNQDATIQFRLPIALKEALRVRAGNEMSEYLRQLVERDLAPPDPKPRRVTDLKEPPVYKEVPPISEEAKEDLIRNLKAKGLVPRKESDGSS